MPALHDLQRRFGSALLGGDVSAIAPFIRGGSLDPVRRLAIYRNNSRENFTATLMSAFPVLLQLAGEDYFRQVAIEFQERHPSNSGNLHHLGAPLAAFLERRLAKTRYEYFADIARLEWAYQEVLIAADHAPLAVERLASVPESAWPALGFKLHCATRLVRAGSPILSLWSAHQDERASLEANRLESIDLSIAEAVLVRRAGRDVELRLLPETEFAFLAALDGEATLAGAADAAIDLDPSFDLAACLQRYVGLAVLVDFRLPGERS